MKSIILILFSLSLVISSTYSLAKPPRGDAVDNSQGLSQAVKKVKKRTGGRILSANTMDKKGRQFYKVKVLLPNGKVRIIRVDAE